MFFISFLFTYPKTFETGFSVLGFEQRVFYSIVLRKRDLNGGATRFLHVLRCTVHCCFFPIVTLFCGFTWLTFFVNPGLRRAVLEATIGGSWDESFGDSRYPIPDLPGASRRSTCSRNSRQGAKYAKWPRTTAALLIRHFRGRKSNNFLRNSRRMRLAGCCGLGVGCGSLVEAVVGGGRLVEGRSLTMGMRRGGEWKGAVPNVSATQRES